MTTINTTLDQTQAPMQTLNNNMDPTQAPMMTQAMIPDNESGWPYFFGMVFVVVAILLHFYIYWKCCRKGQQQQQQQQQEPATKIHVSPLPARRKSPSIAVDVGEEEEPELASTPTNFKIEPSAPPPPYDLAVSEEELNPKMHKSEEKKLL